MKFVYNLKYFLGPVSDNKQRCISVIKEWNVKDTTILLNEVLEADPLITVDVLVHNVYLFVASRQADLLFEFAYV
jgi:hypothetical protein